MGEILLKISAALKILETSHEKACVPNKTVDVLQFQRYEDYEDNSYFFMYEL